MIRYNDSLDGVFSGRLSKWQGLLSRGQHVFRRRQTSQPADDSRSPYSTASKGSRISGFFSRLRSNTSPISVAQSAQTSISLPATRYSGQSTLISGRKRLGRRRDTASGGSGRPAAISSRSDRPVFVGISCYSLLVN
jgi:hypothetical protein